MGRPFIQRIAFASNIVRCFGTFLGDPRLAALSSLLGGL